MRDRRGDGEVRLAGPRRTDREDQIIVADGVQVDTLVEALGRHITPVDGAQATGREKLLKRGRAIVAEEPRGDFDVPLLQRVTGPDHGDQLGDEVGGQRLSLRLPLNRQVAATRRYPNAEVALDRPEVLVVVPEEIDEDLLRDSELAHSFG